MYKKCTCCIIFFFLQPALLANLEEEKQWPYSLFCYLFGVAYIQKGLEGSNPLIQESLWNAAVTLLPSPFSCAEVPDPVRVCTSALWACLSNPPLAYIRIAKPCTTIYFHFSCFYYTTLFIQVPLTHLNSPFELHSAIPDHVFFTSPDTHRKISW